MKTTITKALAIGAATLTLAGGALAVSSTSATAAGKSYHGCPRGALCLYPRNAGYNHDKPSYVFFSYAGHNIHDQYGLHTMVDNQYGAHYEGLCAKYGGKGGFAKSDGVHDVGFGGTAGASTTASVYTVNLSPVDSVDLRPDSQRNSTCHR